MRGSKWGHFRPADEEPPDRGVVKQKGEEKWGSLEVKRKDERTKAREESNTGNV